MKGFKILASKTSAILACWFLALLILLAVFASVIANEKPLYIKIGGQHFFPALSIKGYAKMKDPETGKERFISYSTVNWKEIKSEKAVWCPVIFSPGKSDPENPEYVGPLEKSPEGEQVHLLGTSKTGADVFSGILHGTRISLTVGILSMLLSGIIGIMLGAAAGFFGDRKIHVSKSGLWITLVIGLPLAWFYGVHLGSELVLNDSGWPQIVLYLIFVLVMATLILFVIYKFGEIIGKIFRYESKSGLPVDQLVSRGIEVFNSVPRIVLILTISAISRPSLINLILIIGLTSWTEIARLVRAEMLRVRESEFMQSAEASGIKLPRQIFYHALPNVVLPGLTAITLGIASAILTESALSFLGIGVPADVVTWGSLLNEGRQNFHAWWLIAFPGLAIFTTVLAINIVGDALSEAIDPRRKRGNG